MWQQNLTLIEEHRKEMEREVKHQQLVRQLRSQHSRSNTTLPIIGVPEVRAFVSRFMSKRSTLHNTRLKINQA